MKWGGDRTRIPRITRIHTDGEIRDNPSYPCHTCALPDGALHQARRGLGARGERGGEGAGIVDHERQGFKAMQANHPCSSLFGEEYQ